MKEYLVFLSLDLEWTSCFPKPRELLHRGEWLLFYWSGSSKNSPLTWLSLHRLVCVSARVLWASIHEAVHRPPLWTCKNILVQLSLLFLILEITLQFLRKETADTWDNPQQMSWLQRLLFLMVLHLIYISQALGHASTCCTPKALVAVLGQNDFEGFSAWREDDAHNNWCSKPHTLTSMTMMKASLAAMTCQ